MRALCEVEHGEAKSSCGAASDHSLCELLWSCRARRLQASFSFQFSMADLTAPIGQIPVLHTALGASPADVVVLDSLHWDIMLFVRLSQSTLASKLRHASSVSLRSGRALPTDLVEQLAAAWEHNFTRYMANVHRGYAARARAGAALPTLIWATTHEVVSPRSLAVGTRTGEGSFGRCRTDCLSQREFDINLQQASRNTSVLGCCMPYYAELTRALNARARAVLAQQREVLLLDIERMMSSLTPTTYLWDGAHLRHEYSAQLAQLVMAIAASPRTAPHSLRRIALGARKSPR